MTLFVYVLWDYNCTVTQIYNYKLQFTGWKVCAQNYFELKWSAFTVLQTIGKVCSWEIIKITIFLSFVTCPPSLHSQPSIVVRTYAYTNINCIPFLLSFPPHMCHTHLCNEVRGEAILSRYGADSITSVLCAADKGENILQFSCFWIAICSICSS